MLSTTSRYSTFSFACIRNIREAVERCIRTEEALEVTNTLGTTLPAVHEPLNLDDWHEIIILY
jgi:hypothetical protein